MVPFTRADLPDNGAELLPNGSIMFKHTPVVFKQIVNQHGKVVGVMYKGPRMESFTTYGQAQVKSLLGGYQRRSSKDVSESVSKGLDIWEWAYGLFLKQETGHQAPTHVQASPIVV